MTQLMRGDCLELMKRIPDGSVNMVLCDLPYGTTKNEWDCIVPFVPLWAEYDRVCKQNAAIVLFSQMPFTAELVSSCRNLYRYEWIWEKTNPTGFLNAKKMPLKCHENICVFYKKLPTYNPQFGDGAPYRKLRRSGTSSNYGGFAGVLTQSDGIRYPRDVLTFSNASSGKDKGEHPTQKPVALCEYLIRTYTNEGDTVLDNCMGSGTTGVACVRTGRDFIGMELNERYFNTACRRIECETTQLKMTL